MFGEDAGYISAKICQLSEDHNAMVDKKVQQILKVSFQLVLIILIQESKARVTELLQSKEIALRDLAVGLYKYDYLNSDEMDIIFSGKKLDKKEVREYDPKLSDYNMACSIEAAEFETETSSFMYSEPAEVTHELQADYQAPITVN